MQETLKQLETSALAQIASAENTTSLDLIKIQFLGKKGQLTAALKGLSAVPPEKRPEIGQLVNGVKAKIQAALDEKQITFRQQEQLADLQALAVDASLPALGPKLGTKHPLNQVTDEIIEIFKRIGFSVKTGPDIETDYYNFEALNIPADHPARDMHDTFYMKSGHVMRTHTSPVQIRVMEQTKPPIKVIVPGNVYRCDSDVSHSPMFHQIEGLYVAENVTFAHLKGTLSYFLRELFGPDKKVRFRPSYFPFTEPSTEVDVACVNCNQSGCALCKQTGWIEILGAGMVNRNVFRSVKYDPDTVTGFAFGMGIERITMLKFGINDIRLFFENDLRFLRQF